MAGMKRIAILLLAAFLLPSPALPAPAEEETPPAARSGKAVKPRKAKRETRRADELAPVRRVRDALAELDISFFPDEDDGNVFHFFFEEEDLFRGKVRFRIAYHPEGDLLQAQGILAEEDLVAENIPRAFVFASRRAAETYFPKIIVDTDVPGGALVTEWNWQPLAGMDDEALERNLLMFLTSSFGVVSAAIEEDIYPASLAAGEEDGSEEDEPDFPESPFP